MQKKEDSKRKKKYYMMNNLIFFQIQDKNIIFIKIISLLIIIS